MHTGLRLHSLTECAFIQLPSEINNYIASLCGANLIRELVIEPYDICYLGCCFLGMQSTPICKCQAVELHHSPVGFVVWEISGSQPSRCVRFLNNTTDRTLRSLVVFESHADEVGNKLVVCKRMAFSLITDVQVFNLLSEHFDEVSFDINDGSE